MRINLVTGVAGFLGSHLIDRLMESGDEVICLDNYLTGRELNIFHWSGDPCFAIISDNNLKAILARAFDSSVMHFIKSLRQSNLSAHFCKTFSTS